MTAMLTISFMIRNTSPIGWVPLLLIKIVKDKSLVAFIISGIVVFIPIVCFCTILDSIYYGELTFTAYNFLKANLTEGLSKYFGTDPIYFYLIAIMPLLFIVAYPAVLISFVIYFKDSLSKK